MRHAHHVCHRQALARASARLLRLVCSVVQVADFGLARVLKDKGHIKTQTFGTVTHMPPELLAKGEYRALSTCSWEDRCSWGGRVLRSQKGAC